ncbi:hypothetical protein PT974_12037 [Cladobotryum mycophilum]|uniref:Uncharacterized protein n=1 Tax=Cladobotryum mycophilum TaxID=491253 RepID=A0ABR0S7W8_9HYPO
MSTNSISTLPRAAGHQVHKLALQIYPTRISQVTRRNLQLLPRAVEKTPKRSLESRLAMTQHGKSVLQDLSKHRIIRCHSASRIGRTLYARGCASCGAFGSHVFLPIFTRVCFHCISKSPLCKLVDPATAQRCFALSHRQRWGAIPAVHLYDTTPFQRKYRSVVSVEAARQLAVQIHGSMQAVAEASKQSGTRPRGPKNPMSKRLSEYTFTLEDLLSPGFLSTTSISASLSSRMPRINKRSGEVEFGVKCIGCAETASLGRRRLLRKAVLDQVLPKHCTPKEGFRIITTREWAREDLLEHVTQCYGIRKMVEDEE